MGDDAMRSSEFGRWGPFRVHAVAHDDRIGWMIVVGVEGSEERVFVRTSPKGRSGLSVEHVLYGRGDDG